MITTNTPALRPRRQALAWALILAVMATLGWFAGREISGWLLAADDAVLDWGDMFLMSLVVAYNAFRCGDL